MTNKDMENHNETEESETQPIDERDMLLEAAREFTEESKWEEAIFALTALLELEPENARVYDRRGIAYGNVYEYEKSIADFSKAIELKPRYFGAYNNRALSNYRLTRYDDAIHDYNLAIALKPNEALFYANRGLCYYRKEQFLRAIEDYDKAIELEEELGETHGNRGEAYLALGRLKEALTDFERELELNPQDANAFANRAVVLSQLKTAKSKAPELEIIWKMVDRSELKCGHGIEIHYCTDTKMRRHDKASIVAFVEDFKWLRKQNYAIVKLVNPSTSSVMVGEEIDHNNFIQHIKASVTPFLKKRELPKPDAFIGENLATWING